MSKAVLEAMLVMAALSATAASSPWLQQPLLAPGLGSAASIQVMSRAERSARAYDTAVAQLAGVAGGFVGVYVAFATMVPMFLGDHPSVWARIWRWRLPWVRQWWARDCSRRAGRQAAPD